jgi:hypothetical protein
VDRTASDDLSTGYLLWGGCHGHLVSGRRRTWPDWEIIVRAILEHTLSNRLG